MKTVGLVGEDPNDTSSIANLLNQKYHAKIRFVKLANRVRGSQLDSEKFKKQIAFDFESEECDFAICIRDLDGFETQTEKTSSRLKWFNDIEKNTISILFLIVWELEALIYADVETFNKAYSTKLSSKGNSLSIKEPKEKLKIATRKTKREFHENHCPEIFKKLDFETVAKNHSGFKKFTTLFEHHLSK